jgi:hypothetical protein
MYAKILSCGVLNADVPEYLGHAAQAMIRAADLFKPEYGWRFITYAGTAIRNNVLRAVMDDRLIRTPRDNPSACRVAAFDAGEWDTAISREPSPLDQAIMREEVEIAAGVQREAIENVSERLSDYWFIRNVGTAKPTRISSFNGHIDRRTIVAAFDNAFDDAGREIPDRRPASTRRNR